MKLTFATVVIGDDAPASGARRTIVVNQIGGAAVVQTEPLAGGANPFNKSRNNVSGSLAFTVTNTFADVDDANEFIVAEYNRTGTQGDLVWERAATLFTFDDAVLQSVTCTPFGVTVFVQYTFVITTVTLPTPP
jgi:hypothetical protein